MRYCVRGPGNGNSCFGRSSSDSIGDAAHGQCVVFQAAYYHDIQWVSFYPGGNELASTNSSASFCISSTSLCKGDLGSAVSPVRVDSRIPKGETNFMNASILVGFADLMAFKVSTLDAGRRGKNRRELTLRRYNCSYLYPTLFLQIDVSGG